MRTQEELISDIFEAIAGIRRYRSSNELPTRVREVWLIYHLMVIGEAAKLLDPATRQAIPSQRWPSIISLRNRLIHGYFDIRMSIVEDAARMKVDDLEQALKDHLDKAGQAKDATE